MLLKGVCCILIVQTCIVSCARNRSLTFVIDDTGSMDDVILQVKQVASEIMDIVTSKKGSEVKDVILVTFNDPGAKVIKNASDNDTLLSALNKIHVHGGGDCPEYALSGIITALQESRQDSYLYVFTDADAKDYDRLNEVKSLCEKKQSQVVFVVTLGDCIHGYIKQLSAYYEIARVSNGLVFIISKNDVKDIVDTIPDIISDQRSVITSKVIPPSKDFVAIEFAVDDKTEYVTIHTSGEHVDIKVTDSKRYPMAIEKTLWKPTVKMVKFNAPSKGNYYAWVKGDSDVTIVVYAATDFTFDHGFSEFVPKSLADASKQPIAYRPHHLSISVTDPEHTVHIKSAEILDMDEKVLYTLPLKKASGDFYITHKFKSPDQMFKIQVTGEVKRTGKEIKRISKTAIEPQIPPPPSSKAPVVTITEGSRVDVDYAGDIELTCKVSGYPEPRIWWTSADGTTVSEESHVVELPYDYISYLKLTNIKHTGTYQCRAQNKKATKFAEVLVNRRSPFLIQTPPPKTISVKYEEPTTIRCDAKSSMPMKMKWYYQKDEHSPRSEILPSDKYSISSDKHDLRILSTRLDHVGKYTCEAYLVVDETERKSFTTNVEIKNLKTPEITYSNKTITVKKGDIMSAFCKTDGIPKPVVTWQFKSIASDVFIAMPNKGERISEPNIGYEKAGLYTCTATNALGAENRTIDVIVNGVPRITNIDTVYYGLTGDKVLRIPCEVDGFPEPTITWRNEDKVVSSGAKLSIIKNSIYIKNPSEKDSNNYTCEAKNAYGFDTKTFKADVSDFIIYDEAFNSNIYLKLNESKDLKCLLPHSDPKSIRWYVNGENTKVFGTFYSLKNAQYSNDGNYTCRLNTDEGSESLNYVVDVGYKPSFKADAPATIDWQGNKDDTLDCDVDAKPSAKVKWFYNGKPLDVVWPELAISGWGQYTCIASNEHDSVQRTFNVTSNGCLINRTAVDGNHIPLLVDDEQTTWPEFATTSEFYTIAQNEMITLECATLDQPDNTFKTLPKVERINAKCYREDQFMIDGNPYKFSDLQCKSDVRPSQVFTKTSCMKNGEVVEVGFNLIKGFLRVYEVCYSGTDRRTLYTKVVMSAVNSGNIVTPNFKHRETKGGRHSAEPKKCAYNLRRLVNPEDVAFGPAQTATMSELYNTATVYEPCERSSRWSWSGVDKSIESVLYSFDTVTVWTGASQRDASGIPRYLWKVMLFDDDTFETIVYVNAANPSSSDILCPETATDRLTDVTDAGDQFTYVCSMDDFLKAFKATLTDFQ